MSFSRMSELGFEWNMLEQIKLREHEIRLRNADALRAVLFDQISIFATRHVLNPWAVVRPLAIEMKTAATSCLDEYRAIGESVEAIAVPDNQPLGLARKKAVAAYATTAVKIIEPVLHNIDIVIEGEDQRAYEA